jgi:hypothetical protein
LATWPPKRVIASAGALAGYCGNSEALHDALTDFAEAYGDQTERDHAAPLEAIKDGRVAVAADEH